MTTVNAVKQRRRGPLSAALGGPHATPGQGRRRRSSGDQINGGGARDLAGIVLGAAVSRAVGTVRTRARRRVGWWWWLARGRPEYPSAASMGGDGVRGHVRNGLGGTRGREEGLAGLLGTPGARRRARTGAMAAVATAVTQQGGGRVSVTGERAMGCGELVRGGGGGGAHSESVGSRQRARGEPVEQVDGEVARWP